MSKSKLSTRRKSKILVWFLGISIVLSTTLVLARIYYPPQISDVNLVSAPSLSIGPNILRGRVGTYSDKYILILDNSQTVELDTSGTNYLIDRFVEVEGDISQDAYGNYVMQVNQIKTI